MTQPGVVFRVDASLQIGCGHVMRCLALACALQAQGKRCHFICRDHPGNLIDLIRHRGFPVSALAAGSPDYQPAASDSDSGPAHASWLGIDQRDDAGVTAATLSGLKPDWLVVDHYALDCAWERALRSHCGRLMVIDDLADRPHDCDLLLDQNFGRAAKDYDGLVPATCKVLAGTRYALLRPEFAELREYSLQRRQQSPRLRRLLVSMGGVDQANATGIALDALQHCPLPEDCTITVVMGPHAPWLQEVQVQANAISRQCEVLVNVSNMGRLMADSDLAIGAAGSTLWERCVLGLPTVMVVLAGNQRPAATAVAQAGGAHIIDDVESMASQLPKQLASLSKSLEQSSQEASALCDGHGTSRVIPAIIAFGCKIRPMTRDDLEIVLYWRNHEEVRRFMYNQHAITLIEHSEWFERSALDHSRHLLIIEEAGTPLGFVQFTETGNDGVAEWGFYAAPDASRGTGRKLASLALAHAFDQLRIRKIYGEAIDFNERSMAFHQKLGFREEGVLCDKYFDGSRHHHVHRFGLRASEWRG